MVLENILLTIHDLFFTIYWIGYVLAAAIRAGLIPELFRILLEKVMWWM